MVAKEKKGEKNKMVNLNSTKFRNNFFDYLNQTITCNSIINIATKNGNAIVLSEEEYNGLVETAYLNQAGLGANIVKGMKTPIGECKEIDWNEWNIQ